jgi:tRNA G26 N,N-dimethylase Trm1
MERSKIALIAAASLALASGAMAQQPAPQTAPQAGQVQEIQLSDADLEKFADIYVDLLETEAKFEEEFAGIETEEQARELQTRMQQESVAKLARHGWTAERYVLTGEAIKADATLTEKTIAMIEQRD